MWHDLSRRLAKGFLRLANWLVDGLVLSFVVIVVLYSGYVLVDNGKVVDGASSQVFESYKPEAETEGFEELEAQNPDVRAWLTLYGTGVDYPVVQGADNSEYLNTDARGEFALSGSLFVDYECAGDFSGASTIVYGHHMEDSLMFGDLENYSNETYLREHDHGDLYYGGTHHGVEVVGYILGDAYESYLYSKTVGTSPSSAEYFAYLRDHASVWVGDLQPADKVLVMSTCTSSTNGRHVVVARITDQTFENPYREEEVARTLTGGAGEGFPLWAKVGIGLLVLLAVAWVVGAPGKGRGKNKGKRAA